MDRMGRFSGEEPLNMMPRRPSLGKPHLISNMSAADENARDSLRVPNTPLEYDVLMYQRDTQGDIPLLLGFTIPIGERNRPVPLHVGGVRPSESEQLASIYYGQDTDQGFNLLGMNVALPPWLGGFVRTHTSADLVYRYRNEPEGWHRQLDGFLLDQIHPGYPSLIDSEVDHVVPGDVVTSGGFADPTGATRGHFPRGFSFYQLRGFLNG